MEIFMIFFTVLVMIILSGAEVDLFVPSFPELMHTFNLSPVAVQLTLSTNFIAQCIASFYVGSFGDIFGRRKVILGGLALFLIGSVCCTYASAFWVILVGRTLQGIGIAAPSVLGYVVIADQVPLEKQAGVMGILNGMITIAMALAPVVGSFVNMAYGWQGNFMTLLLLGCFATILAIAFVPKDKERTQQKEPVSLSLKPYLPLLKSGRFLSILCLIGLWTTPFWVFIGTSPILYMEDLGVSIEHFGWYQGAICGAFSVVSLLSPKIMNAFGKHACYRFSSTVIMIAATLVILTGIFLKDAPLLITILMCLTLVNCVMPINILYPVALEIVPGTKGRASALFNVIKLVLAAVGVEIVGYFYTGTFFPLALYVFIAVLIGFGFAIKTREWKGIPRYT